MKITISGKAGSGKSFIAKELAEKLKLKHYSMGDLQRKYAKEKGLTIEELGELEAKDDKIDREVDNYLAELSKKQDDFVVDGWISFNFVKNAIKIFLDCDLDESAKRLFNANRDKSERKTKSIEESKKIIEKRTKTNRGRFLRYYSVDFLDMKNYDLVVDTTKISKKEVFEKILKFINKL